MIWNLLLKNFNKKKIEVNFFENLNIIQKKNTIKVLKKFNQKNKIDLIQRLLKNNFKNQLKKKKNNYKLFLYQKNSIQKKNEFLKKIISINLNKKQIICNISENLKNIHFLTNGMVLKNLEILEKKRKKEIKFSIINLTKTLNKTKLTITTVSVNKLKPYISKIIKIVKNFFKKNENKLNLIVSPKIPFNRLNFKKVKSIKRRLRKKYNLLDF